MMTLSISDRWIGATFLVLLLGGSACGQEEARRTAAPASTPPAIRESIAPVIQSVGGLQARTTETPGLVADLLSARREEGLLIVTVRFRNAGSDTLAVALPTGAGTYPGLRLEAGGRAWTIARDAWGEPMAPETFERTLAPGESMLWRGSFEAPPRSATAFDLAMPGVVQPFDDVPIHDPPPK